MKYSNVFILMIGLIVQGTDLIAKPMNQVAFDLVEACLGDCAIVFKPILGLVGQNQYAHKKDDDKGHDLIHDSGDSDNESPEMQKALRLSFKESKKKDLMHSSAIDFRSKRSSGAQRRKKKIAAQSPEIQPLKAQLHNKFIEYKKNHSDQLRQDIKKLTLKKAILEGMPELEEVPGCIK